MHSTSRFCGQRLAQAGLGKGLVPTSTQRRQRRGATVVTNLFTGIVQGTAEVAEVTRQPDFATVQIVLPPERAEGARIGASVAINGTCLTVTTVGTSGRLSFDIMSETLRATNLGLLEPGSRVNFERSARVGDEIGGHTVSGHVHTTAEISAVEVDGPNRRVSFRLNDASKWMKYVLPKGFVAVDGASLTVGEVWADGFSVYLIPETLRATLFGTKGQDDSVNIEIEAQTQAIVDTVERVVAQRLGQQ